VEHHPTQAAKIELSAGTRDGIQIIRVHGPLTIHNFFDFQDLTRQQSETPVLLIDFTEVPYLDSAALGSLVGIHVSRGKTGRKYALVNVNDRIQKMFAITGVEQFLVTYENADAAEKALSSSS
jgi:anti-sigma B factor antagonist